MGKGLTIIAFVLSLLFFVPFASIIGLILGIVAYKKGKDDPASLPGLAIAAIVIGAVFGIIGLITGLGMFMGFLNAI